MPICIGINRPKNKGWSDENIRLCCLWMDDGFLRYKIPSFTDTRITKIKVYLYMEEFLFLYERRNYESNRDRKTDR